MNNIHEWFGHHVGAEVTVWIRSPGVGPEGHWVETGRVTRSGMDYVSLQHPAATEEVHVPFSSIATWTVAPRKEK